MMIEEIRANMKKELDQQKAKVEMAGRQRAMIAQQGERIEKQHAECKVVLMELEQTEGDAVCYKAIGPALVPKTLAETIELVKQRQATSEEQLKKLRAALDEAQKSFQAESKTMKELQEKAKQIEEALA